MAIEVVEGKAPFVIDRRMPAPIFETAPGAYSLVSRDGETAPLEFDAAEDAVELLRGELDGKTLHAYDWRVLPTENVKGYSGSEWEQTAQT